MTRFTVERRQRDEPRGASGARPRAAWPRRELEVSSRRGEGKRLISGCSVVDEENLKERIALGVFFLAVRPPTFHKPRCEIPRSRCDPAVYDSEIEKSPGLDFASVGPKIVVKLALI